MAKKMVWVEIDPDTSIPIRIIRTTHEAVSLSPDVVRQMAKSAAVGFIREQVINRAKRGNVIYCEYCGDPINAYIGHMHERTPRGNEGEISLDNCVFLCPRCHIGWDGEHSNRRWHPAKTREEYDKGYNEE